MSKLVFATLVLVVGLAFYGTLRRRAEGLPAGVRTVVPRVVLGLAVGVPAAILVFSVFRIIPAGHVGVKVLFGQVDPEPLREGLNIVWNPLYDIVVMDGRVGKHVAKYDAASKDLQAVHVEMVLNYRLHPDRAPEVYRSIGLEYSSVIIDPAAQEVLKANTATHNAAEILLLRPAIKGTSGSTRPTRRRSRRNRSRSRRPSRSATSSSRRSGRRRSSRPPPRAAVTRRARRPRAWPKPPGSRAMRRRPTTPACPPLSPPRSSSSSTWPGGTAGCRSTRSAAMRCPSSRCRV
jgi:hypothetical protein